jgi:hypothetical protein
MTYQEAESKLRAAARALRDRDRGLKQRTTATLTLTFGTNARVAVMWIAALERDQGDHDISAMVDARLEVEQDHPASIITFGSHASEEEIVNWVFDALCLRP